MPNARGWLYLERSTVSDRSHKQPSYDPVLAKDFHILSSFNYSHKLMINGLDEIDGVVKETLLGLYIDNATEQNNLRFVVQQLHTEIKTVILLLRYVQISL